MIAPSIRPPAGHGEVLTLPSFAEWADLMRSNREEVRHWRFQVAGMPAPLLRAQARKEAIAAASAFSARLGVPVRPVGPEPEHIAITGHQPELYHPGVWVKAFLLQRLADEAGAAPLDLVVDSDAFEALGLRFPCRTPALSVRRYTLAHPRACYACTPVPTRDELARFREAGTAALSTLRAPALACHFAQFADALDAAAAGAQNLGELVTLARRRYEAPAGTNYLELPVTLACVQPAFLRFLVDIALGAERFVDAYNTELDSYRRCHRTRSPAQPFPDLERAGDRLELPFWHILPDERTSLWVRPSEGTIELFSGKRPLARIPAEPDLAVRVLAAEGVRLAPKAIPLTLFHRLFVADLFVHGAGGARYDRITDAIAERFYGVRPPRFAVASLTMYLPLGAPVVTEREIDEAERRLERLRHNPDQLLDEVEFEEPEERERAAALAVEKARLVHAIAARDADKKEIGARIRRVNAELAALLAPVATEWAAELEALRAERAASQILTDRTYPFCFWSPLEIQDKAR